MAKTAKSSELTMKTAFRPTCYPNRLDLQIKTMTENTTELENKNELGKYKRGIGLDFADGRKVELIAYENCYIANFKNPDNTPDLQQFILTPEAMSALINLYAYGFADAAFVDHSKFLESLTTECREKLLEIQADAKAILATDNL